jgi:hypothetical protein
MYDGAIKRELAGIEITQHALISSALNLGADHFVTSAAAA